MYTAATVDLPSEYREALRRGGLAPLWEFLQGALPYGRPPAKTQAHCWHYADIRPLLLEAGDRVPVEKAERRVLVLSDPGRGPDAMQVTGSLYAGIQLLLPGEVAPNHRHTPSAARIVIEGHGAVTEVNGRPCPMEPGDVVLTPSMQWHSHHHFGDVPVTWLDILDLPTFTALESAFAEPDAGREDNFARVAFSDLLGQGLIEPAGEPTPDPYPILRYEWAKTRAALLGMAKERPDAEPLELHYVNPRTGDDCLPIFGFTAMLLPNGRATRLPCRSSSGVFHFVEGRGRSKVDGTTFEWEAGDTLSFSTFAEIEHHPAETGPATFLIRVDDAPMQRRLGFFAERAV